MYRLLVTLTILTSSVHSYFRSNMPMPRDIAELFCNTWLTTLATITSEDDQEDAIEACSATPPGISQKQCWIGLKGVGCGTPPPGYCPSYEWDDATVITADTYGFIQSGANIIPGNDEIEDGPWSINVEGIDDEPNNQHVCVRIDLKEGVDPKVWRDIECDDAAEPVYALCNDVPKRCDIQNEQCDCVPNIQCGLSLEDDGRLALLGEATADACCTACDNDINCKSWTFTADTPGKCYLFDAECVIAECVGCKSGGLGSGAPGDDDDDSDSDSDSVDAAAAANANSLFGGENNNHKQSINVRFSQNTIVNLWAIFIVFVVINVVFVYYCCFKKRNKKEVTFEHRGTQ